MGLVSLNAQSPNQEAKTILKPGKTFVSENVKSEGGKKTLAESTAEGGVGEVIGHTTYDLQTNASNPDRVRVDADGNVQIVWTGSTSPSAPEFPDRGTFYRYYDAATGTWTEEPTERLEGNTRTGWPAADFLSNGGEIVISHDPSPGNYNLVSMTRATAGTGEWTGPTAISNEGIWPRIATSGSNVYVIYTHNIGTDDNGDDNFTMFAMSSDNGANWDTTDMVLPGISPANGYVKMTADAYAIDAKDSIVAIMAGGSTNDAVLWKSMDYGQTWETTTVLNIGIKGYNWTDETHITDIDGDGEGDTIVTHDEAYEMIIDNDGVVHVWMGKMVIVDNDQTALWGYFPYDAGMIYWNETMGEDNAEIIEEAVIKDLNGDQQFANDLGADLPGYGPMLISMPGAAYDSESGKIYLVYSAPVENSDIEGDPSDPSAESYRDLYGMIGTPTTTERVDVSYDIDSSYTLDTTNTEYDSTDVITTTYTFDTTATTYDTTATTYDSTQVIDTSSNDTSYTVDTTHSIDTVYTLDTLTTDHDTTLTIDTINNIDSTLVLDSTEISDTIMATSIDWSLPVNLTNSALIQNENVYPSVADFANGKVHVMWMRDDEPGHALENEPDDPRTNDILYKAFSYDDFKVAAPSASFTFDSLSCDLIAFTNTSTGEVWEYIWDFGDGFASTDKDTRHVYQVQADGNQTFEVCLTASNPWGDSTVCQMVTLPCLSVEELLNNGSVNIYPNPTAGQVNIDLNIANGNTVTVEVSNILGSTVYTENVNVAGTRSLTVDLTNENNGVYFINLTVNDEVYTQMITLTK